MKLRLEITNSEIQQLKEKYQSLQGRNKPRLALKAWIAREIVDSLSGATSQRGDWAVAATLRPVIEAELQLLLGGGAA